MKTGLAYIAGFLSVQVHLLRFGILEISALQAYYILVGFWFLLCIAPALATILALEYALSPSDSRRVRVLVVLTGGTIAAAAIAGGSRFAAHQMILNFNAYPYPSWYAVANLANMNFSLVLVWVLSFAYSRFTGSKRTARKIGAAAGAIALSSAIIFFGRTIYPALDHGVGGGAPQFVEIMEDNGHRRIAMQIHAGENYLYLLELTALPAKFESRLAITQFTTDSGGPVFRALADNQILKLRNSRIDIVRIFGLSQRGTIGSYLGK